MRAQFYSLSAIGVLTWSTALGQSGNAPTPTIESCIPLKDVVARLACFDEVAAREVQQKEKARDAELQEKREQLEQTVDWRIRDSATVSPAGLADLGTKPALFNLGRSGGSTFSVVRAAAYGVLQPINQPGGLFDTWQPFFGAGWTRDTTGKVEKDLRQATIGITGNVVDAGPQDTAVIATMRLGVRDEVKSHTRDAFLNLHADILHLPWLVSDQTEATSNLFVVPFLGLLSESSKTSTPAITSSVRRSAIYGGLKAEYQLFRAVPMLSGTASVQWFRDVHVSSDGDKRKPRFFEIGVTYHLVDPKTKRGWLPSVTLTRQSGLNPVTGLGPGAKTTLGLGVRFN